MDLGAERPRINFVECTPGIIPHVYQSSDSAMSRLKTSDSSVTRSAILLSKVNYRNKYTANINVIIICL